MTVRRLVNKFRHVVDLPIEIETIVEEIKNLGYQDQIIICEEEMDTNLVRGIHYKTVEYAAPYADPIYTAYVIYSESLSLSWKRLVCCKELLHICDHRIEHVETPDEVKDLFNKVVTNDLVNQAEPSFQHYIAARDVFSMIPALAILFPSAARERARHELQQSGHSIHDIAKWACLPVGLVAIAIAKEWPDVIESFMNTDLHEYSGN